MTAPVLSITGLCKSYGSSRMVLNGISLELARGEHVAIIGESGVGKSTLLNLIAGLDQPERGRIMLAGAEITRLDDNARTMLRRRHVGFVFQAFHLLPHLTAAQNVALPLALNGAAPEEMAHRTLEMLAAVGLAAAADAYPRTLSGGEMQRVALARALVHRPLLLLADEPTGNLDQVTASQVLALLHEQVRITGGACILVTHSRAAAASADRILRLDAAGLHPE
jgi:putative ABC transport system ATP-binding protein